MTQVKRRRKTGGRKAGSLNKRTLEIRELSAQHVEDALATVIHLMNNSANEHIRLAAANSILDRRFGKPSPYTAIREIEPPKPKLVLLNTGWTPEQHCHYLEINESQFLEMVRRREEYLAGREGEISEIEPDTLYDRER